MEPYILILIGALIGGGSFFMGWSLNARSGQNKIMDAQERAKKIIEEAEKESITTKREKLLEVKDEWYKKKKDFEADAQSKRSKQQAYEKQLNNREENLEKKLDLLTKKESTLQTTGREIADRQKRLIEREKEAVRLIEEENIRLEKISGITSEEAKKYLYQNLIETVKSEATQKLKDIRDGAKIEGKKEAQKAIIQAIQRSAVDFTLETTVSVLNVGSDEMKGRIIGREGRNIRALEQATGVEMIIDDTPEAVTLSSFDPVRREIARIALNKLIQDGRIHPGRIEEMVEKAKKEVEATIRAEGERAVYESGVAGLHPELINLLGRLKYRTSYGQNVLMHSLEVAHLSSLIAAEMGANVELARKAGLLHDLGKAVDHQVEGTHAQIGADLVKQWERNPIISQAIAEHHGETPTTSSVGAIVATADAISGARPGARGESLEQYLKRLEALENLATSFSGVDKCFAIQAGREVRVLVNPQEVDDLTALRLARDIAKKIEETLTYPGQIKVNVIRETRATEYAK
jgi:ribonuclease Y